MFGKLMKGLSRLVGGEATKDARRAPRLQQPSVLVHYWDGSAPEGRRIRDISTTGAYILTNEVWYPGTIVRLILRAYKTNSEAGDQLAPFRTTTISSRVVRPGPDGAAVEFLFPTPKDREALEEFLATIPQTPEPAKCRPSSVEFDS